MKNRPHLTNHFLNPGMTCLFIFLLLFWGFIFGGKSEKRRGNFVGKLWKERKKYPGLLVIQIALPENLPWKLL